MGKTQGWLIYLNHMDTLLNKKLYPNQYLVNHLEIKMLLLSFGQQTYGLTYLEEAAQWRVGLEYLNSQIVVVMLVIKGPLPTTCLALGCL